MKKLMSILLSIMMTFASFTAVYADTVTEVDSSSTLKYAIDEADYADSNVKITLLSDVTLEKALDITLEHNSVTLDLGGHTLTGRVNLIKGNLTVQNGTIAGGNEQPLNVYGSSSTSAENYSVLTIEKNATVTGNEFGVCLFGNTATTKGYGAVVNINGTVTTIGTGAEGAVFVSGNLGVGESGDMNNVINIYGNVTSKKDAALALNGNATVNINSGAKLTGDTAITVKRGVLNVNGGTITSTGTNREPGTPNNNGTEMTGAGISVTNTYNGNGPLAVNINAGTIISEQGHSIFKEEDTYVNPANITVKGGSFSDLECLKYIDKEATSNNPVYVSLNNHVNNARGISVPSGTNVAVDFGGFAYSVKMPGAGSSGTESNGFQLLKDSTITFKNGTINCPESNKTANVESGAGTIKGIRLLIQNYCDLTLTDMVIDGTNLAHRSVQASYVVSNNCGNVKFDGNTSIIAANNDFAFDAYKDNSYSPPKVTVDSTGEFTGKVEVSEGATLIINNGTFTDPNAIRYLTAGNAINVILDKGYVLNKSIDVKGTVVLDLNGNTITPSVISSEKLNGNDYLFAVLHGGSLTINDSIGDGTIGSQTGDNTMVGIKMTKANDGSSETATLVLNNGSIYGSDYGISGNGNEGRGNTSITINGGKVIANKTDYSGSDIPVGIYHPQVGQLTITGGEIAGINGVYVKCGTTVTPININGGTIKTTASSSTTYNHNGNGASAAGYAFVVDNADYPGGQPYVQIGSGNFISFENGLPIVSFAKQAGHENTKFITGGTYTIDLGNNDATKNLIADGYVCKNYGQNKWTVVKKNDESKKEIIIDQKTKINTDVSGNISVKKVEGLESATDVQSLINSIRSQSGKENAKVDVQINLEVNLSTDGIEENKILSKIDESKGQIIKSLIEIIVNQTVKVDNVSDSALSKKIPVTNNYQYIPVILPQDISSNKVLIIRNHNESTDVLQKAASRYDAEHYDGDCFYIHEGTVVIKSKNFSVYAIVTQTADVPAYVYVAPEVPAPKPKTKKTVFVAPKTGVE